MKATTPNRRNSTRTRRDSTRPVTLTTRNNHWVSDTTASRCSICETTFSLFIRKHHCRSCGKIFCDSCSSTRHPLTNLGYREHVRLCDICAKDIEICMEENIRYDQTNITHVEVIKEWVFLVSSVDYTRELESKILHGIPNSLRSLVWTELCSANHLIAKNSGIYDIYLARPNPEVDEPIALDIPRTSLPDHPRIGVKGNQNNSIANVLRAYANFNPEVGYSQGMAWIVAALLMHMNEENAFWVFVQMMKKYSLVSFFEKKEEEIECLSNFVRSFRKTLPQVEAHIVAHGGEPSMFARQWIRTLFVPDFDLAIVFRLWDIFFVEKLEFCMNFIITMFMQAQHKILALSGSQTLIYVNNLPKEFWNTNIDQLITLSVKNHASMRTVGKIFPVVPSGNNLKELVVG